MSSFLGQKRDQQAIKQLRDVNAGGAQVRLECTDKAK